MRPYIAYSMSYIDMADSVVRISYIVLRSFVCDILYTNDDIRLFDMRYANDDIRSLESKQVAVFPEPELLCFISGHQAFQVCPELY